MGFVDQHLKVRITNLTIDRYIKLGYKCNIGDIIDISTKDAPNNGTLKIKLMCDVCGYIKEFGCSSLYADSHKGGDYICDRCNKEKLTSRKCSVCGSTDGTTFYNPYNDLLCNKHKSQFRKNGEISTRTLWDKNEITMYKDYAEFYTYDRKYNVNGVFKIDLDMVDFVKTHKIHKHNDGYASYKENGSKQNKRLHRHIMGLSNTSDMVVDHINGDKSDNRKSNLRITNPTINNINVVGGYSHNTSGVTGVSISKDGTKVESYIHRKNKKIPLYHGTSFKDAVIAREIGELEYFGEYSPRYDELIVKYSDCDICVGKYL